MALGAYITARKYTVSEYYVVQFKTGYFKEYPRLLHNKNESVTKW